MPVSPVATTNIAGPATIGATPAAAGPLGGFEALLATLFGAQAGDAAGVSNPFQVSNTDGDAAKDEAPSGDLSTGDTAAAQSLLAGFIAPVVMPIVAAPADAPKVSENGGSLQAAPTVNLPLLAATAEDASQPASAPASPAGVTPAIPDMAAGAANSKGAAEPLLAAATTQPTQPALAEVDASAPAPQIPQATPAATPPVDQTMSGVTPAAPQVTAAVAPPRTSAASKPEAEPKAEADPAATGKDGGPAAPDALKASAPGAKTSPTVGQTAARKHETLDAAAPEAPDPKVAQDPQTARLPDTQAPTATAAHTPIVHAASVRGAPETVATLAAQILKKLDSKTTRFDMELEPYGMGKVDVRLEIGAQGRLTAAMAFENPQSAQELRNRANELTRALEQAGFDVRDGLSFDVADNPGNGANQNNGAQEQARDAPARGRAFLAAMQNASGADAPPPVNLSYVRLRASGVDIKI